MVVDVSKHLSLLYTDNMDIFRHVREVGERGENTTKLSLTSVITNVPCRLSYSNTSSTYDNNLHGVEIIAKVFCNKNVDVKPGDKLVIKRFDGSTLTFNSANSKVMSFKLYGSHLEIDLFNQKLV